MRKRKVLLTTSLPLRETTEPAPTHMNAVTITVIDGFTKIPLDDQSPISNNYEPNEQEY